MPAPLSTSRSLHRQPRAVFLDYLDRIFATGERGDAREESFYRHLLDLLEWAAERLGRDVAVTMIPKKTADCLLDFQVWRGPRVAGYVEAKRPGTDLGQAAESPQLERYRKTFPNLLLTDFREFRLFRHGAQVARADLARPAAGEEDALTLLDLFFDFAAPPAADAATLASSLAGRTRVLKGRIERLLADDTEKASDLAGFYKAFSEHLLVGLTVPEFADLYAQTIAYGLLAARSRAADGFDRHTVGRHIPRTNGILRDAFQYISLGTAPPEVGWIVDDIVDLLAAAPVSAMLRPAARRGGDPVLHFYETFLHHYDRALRKSRGVYYTPQPLVSYVVRSVHRLLQTRLGRRDGLADPSVTLLDPAAGTLTFVVEAIRHAVAATRAEVGDGAVPALLRDHLLRDFHAFELMMAPYAMGHLKVSLLLAEMGHPLTEHERFKLYLTNALETEDLEQSPLPGAASLSRESREAGRLKKEQRMTVVLGNPPWSGHSANRRAALVTTPYTAADGRRVEGYHRVDGRPLEEKNPKWLQDDYVKFLRFAQRKIDEAGEGIVALVTNHSFLDNPTFRGLRQSLLASFDEVYLLDLHGNGKKKERAPGGGADGNVFADVRQGAAVALLVKQPGLPRRICRADLWGSRGSKLSWLAEHDVESTAWREIAPAAPAFLFAPRDARLAAEYAQGLALPEIFPEHSVGIVTGRDAFVIDSDLADLRRRINIFRGLAMPDEILKQSEDLREAGRWRLAEARRRARLDERWDERFARLLYRPFDRRYIFFADYLVERPRRRVMDPLLAGRTLGLIVPRQSKEEPGALVTDLIAGHKAVSAYDINSLFPLYLPGDGLWGRTANVAPDLLPRLAGLYGEEPAPEEILNVVYAILYSPAYRRRYADLLRADFPRIPFPSDRGLFLRLAGLGAVLIDLHLLRSPRLARPAVRFEGEGSGRLSGDRRLLREYRPAERRVVVNEEGQAFTGIAPEVWAYRIGGYQVLPHWLAGRAGKRLGQQEIEDFRRTAAAIALTLGIEREIDGIWP